MEITYSVIRGSQNIDYEVFITYRVENLSKNSFLEFSPEDFQIILYDKTSWLSEEQLQPLVTIIANFDTWCHELSLFEVLCTRSWISESTYRFVKSSTRRMKAAVDRLFGVAKSLDIRSNFPQFQTVFNRRF